MCGTVYLSRRSGRELFAAAETHAGDLVRCAIRSADVRSPSMPVRRLRPRTGIADDPAQARKPYVRYDIDGTVWLKSELVDVPDLRLAPVVEQAARRPHSPLPQSRERPKASNAPISLKKSGPSSLASAARRRLGTSHSRAAGGIICGPTPGPTAWLRLAFRSRGGSGRLSR